MPLFSLPEASFPGHVSESGNETVSSAYHFLPAVSSRDTAAPAPFFLVACTAAGDSRQETTLRKTGFRNSMQPLLVFENRRECYMAPLLYLYPGY